MCYGKWDTFVPTDDDIRYTQERLARCDNLEAAIKYQQQLDSIIEGSVMSQYVRPSNQRILEVNRQIDNGSADGAPADYYIFWRKLLETLSQEDENARNINKDVSRRML